jgi:hypothetical protein
MKIELEVPDNKVSFIMELIESIPFIKFRKVESSSTNQMDTTDYLLSTSPNKTRLLAAMDRSKSKDVEYHNLVEE